MSTTHFAKNKGDEPMVTWKGLSNVLVIVFGVAAVLAIPMQFFPFDNCSRRCNSEVTFQVTEDAVVVDSDGPIGIQGKVLDSPYLDLGKTYVFKSWDLETSTLKEGQVVTMICRLYTQKNAERPIDYCSLKDQTVSSTSP